MGDRDDDAPFLRRRGERGYTTEDGIEEMYFNYAQNGRAARAARAREERSNSSGVKEYSHRYTILGRREPGSSEERVLDLSSNVALVARHLISQYPGGLRIVDHQES